MHSHHETPGFPTATPAVAGAAEEMGESALPGADDGFLGRFPEAVAADALADGQPVRRDGLAFRVMLYAALAVGAVTGLSLIAAWILQAVLAGSYIRAGGDYFSAGIEATAARELLSVPVGGFVVVLLLCLVGMCVGAWGIQRGKARTAA
ncbi:hypothetical protein GCM10009596_05840 [Arthrobacter rhombi]|uniref:hypothetical protein n=1 Tax=Arthrobacter rhombi TaxID=71253 RepID=UPI0031D2D336